MRAIISVIGHDKTGILAAVSSKCAEHNVNVEDVTQKVLREFFAMIMLVDMEKCDVSLVEFGEKMNELGKEIGMSIHVMHEDIFNAMHQV